MTSHEIVEFPDKVPPFSTKHSVDQASGQLLGLLRISRMVEPFGDEIGQTCHSNEYGVGVLRTEHHGG